MDCCDSSEYGHRRQSGSVLFGLTHHIQSGTLNGVHVLQIDEIINISAPPNDSQLKYVRLYLILRLIVSFYLDGRMIRTIY